MAIGHVELNNAMTRIQDYTTIKHNEDQKSSVQQNQFQNQFTKELNKDIRQVVKTDLYINTIYCILSITPYTTALNTKESICLYIILFMPNRILLLKIM